MNLLPIAALAAFAGLAGAAANFAASPGFSGRTAGLTCVACHTPPSPTHDDAVAVLEGLPEEWGVGQTYRLTVRVEGGPPAMPSPAPQGGFDLAIDGGRLTILDDDLLRMHGPEEVTYNPAGTMMREWQVDWTAPTLAAQPRPVGVWLAVLAANGNHVVATNTSDQGETFDAAAALHMEVPPEAAAVEAWQALPLRAPHVDLQLGAVVTLVGRQQDANATAIAWSVDGSDWSRQETAKQWTLRLGGLSAGPHEVAVRSEGADRSSPPQTFAFDTTTAGDAVEHVAPAQATALPVALALLAFLAWRSR